MKGTPKMFTYSGWNDQSLVDLIGSPSEPPPYYLLAKELAGKGSEAHYVGHGLYIPAFREHAYRNYVLEHLARLSSFANGINHLSKVFGRILLESFLVFSESPSFSSSTSAMYSLASSWDSASPKTFESMWSVRSGA
ncbi:MAG: hypothetical protein V9E95_07030 [Methanothrix soehngenii]